MNEYLNALKEINLEIHKEESNYLTLRYLHELYSIHLSFIVMLHHYTSVL